MLIKLKKCHENAQLLKESSSGNVGFDIHAVEETVLKAGAVTKVRTGLAFADYESSIQNLELERVFWDEFRAKNIKVVNSDTPFTVYPKIEGRSGLASQGIFPVGNIIDPNYRGEVTVTLANMGSDYVVKAGDRIAQFVFYSTVTAISFVEVDEVVQTSRGDKGFGSSGR